MRLRVWVVWWTWRTGLARLPSRRRRAVIECVQYAKERNNHMGNLYYSKRRYRVFTASTEVEDPNETQDSPEPHGCLSGSHRMGRRP